MTSAGDADLGDWRERPLPSEVPGFDGARAAGLLPVVPARPPRVSSPTAGALADAVMWRLVVLFGVVVAGALVASALGLPGALVGPVAAIAGLVGFVSVGRQWARVGCRNAAELQRGYTTLQLQFGGFVRRAQRRWRPTGHRTPWDYRGCWRLDASGQVVAPPEPVDHPAPGFYPSPTSSPAFELWTGRVWSGEFLTREQVEALTRL